MSNSNVSSLWQPTGSSSNVRQAKKESLLSRAKPVATQTKPAIDLQDMQNKHNSTEERRKPPGLLSRLGLDTVESEQKDNDVAVATDNLKIDVPKIDMPVTEAAVSGDSAKSAFSETWICEAVNSIINDTQHIKEAISALREIEPDKADAIVSVVRAREGTNWQALLFLWDVYSNIKPIPVNPNLREILPHLDLSKVLELLPEDEVADILRELIGLSKKSDKKQSMVKPLQYNISS